MAALHAAANMVAEIVDPVVYARAVVLVAARKTVHWLGLQDLVCRPPLPATSTAVVVVVVVVVVAVAVAVRVVVAFWAVVFYLTCLDATAVEFVATVAATVVVCRRDSCCAVCCLRRW